MSWSISRPSILANAKARAHTSSHGRENFIVPQCSYCMEENYGGIKLLWIWQIISKISLSVMNHHESQAHDTTLLKLLWVPWYVDHKFINNGSLMDSNLPKFFCQNSSKTYSPNFFTTKAFLHASFIKINEGSYNFLKLILYIPCSLDIP